MKSFVRIFQKKIEHKDKKHKLHPMINHKRILVFDVETTTDTFQNIKVGYFELYYDNKIMKGFIMEDKNNTKKENQIVSKYSKEKGIEIYSVEEFVDNVFYSEVYYQEALCIGFNLQFDITRLAKSFGSGNYTKNKKNKKGEILPEVNHSDKFICNLSERKFNPPIRIKHIDNVKSFISFASNEKKPKFQGNFFDVRILAVILSQNKGISLELAAEKYNTKHKKLKNVKHGRITQEYLDYNIEDVKATFELYENLLIKYKEFNLDLDVTSLYSEASMGKQVYRDLGIKPFLDQNPNFNDEILGNLMSAYYGGWVECPYRKKPVQVAVLDFLSMYPTTFTLMGLWDFVIAEKIKTENCTKEIQNFLDNVTVNDVLKPQFWKNKCILVGFYPNKDLIPCRSKYDENSQPQVGVNCVTSDKIHYLSIFDLVNSKIMTGKTPKIKSAIRFIPVGKQKSLTKTKILGKKLDPNNINVIKYLIEERLKHKFKDSSEDKEIAQYLKIIANAISYGIFLEMNPTGIRADIEAFTNKYFISEVKDFELVGEFFNPIIPVNQIAGSRLLMGCGITKLKELGHEHYYMDTDSFFVPNEIADKLSKCFEKLNPYSVKVDFLEVEKRNKWFYGLCSKRYVLYQIIKGKIYIDPNRAEKDYKLHGLGHILNPFGKEENWQVKIWYDILNLHYNSELEVELRKKYKQYYTISKQTISKPSILKLFKVLNEGKELEEQYKPFNFILVGQSTNKKQCKPIAAYNKNPQSIVNEEFINGKYSKKNKLEYGKIMIGSRYWKIMEDMFFEYIKRGETKFENGNDVGRLNRRNIYIDEFGYIGKEIKNVDEEPLDDNNPSEIINKEEYIEKILNLSVIERRKLGISRQKYYYWKKQAIEGKLIKK